MIFFDIETTALPEADLLALAPEFEAAKNLRDPEKIAANIAEKRAEWLERAALSPETGRVLAIGLYDESFWMFSGDEADILEAFWSGLCSHPEEQFIGWNIFGFDLPFLVRRSWILGIATPSWLRRGRVWDISFIDLMEVYSLGTKQYVSLDTAARALGVGRKTGSGADFGKLWCGTMEQRQQAIEYLQNDVELTQRVGARILRSPAVARKGVAA